MPKNLNATVIGLGSMGWGAAVSLLKAGHTTSGVDVRDEVLENFRNEGGHAFSSAEEGVGTADVVFVFVVNAAQTETVLFGDNGALKSAKPGTIFILCVTMPPSSMTDIAARLETAGMKVIDAPVSGGAAKAVLGEMTVMASGKPEVFELAQPALEAISTKVFRLGDEAGPGSRIKMINQLLAGVHIAAMAEAMTLAASIDIDLETLYEVICECAGNSWMFENRGPHIVDGDYSPKSAVDIFVKDLGIVKSEAAASGALVTLAENAHNLFVEASKAGLGREDDSAVAKILAKKAGIKLPNVD